MSLTRLKPLIYKEWLNTKYFFPVMALQLAFSYLTLLSPNEDFWGERERVSNFFNPGNLSGAFMLFTLTIAVLTAFLMKDERTNNNYSFIASMPFKRSEIWLSKWFCGLFHIIASIFSICILVLLILSFNADIMANLSELIKWSSLSILTYSVLFGLFMLMQSISGSHVFGAVSGLFIAIFPSLLYKSLPILSYYASLNSNLDYLQPGLTLLKKVAFNSSFETIYLNYNGIMPFPRKIPLLMIYLIFTFAASTFMFLKNKFEYTGKFTMFKPFSVATITFVSFDLSSFFLNIAEQTEGISTVPSLLISALIFICTFIILSNYTEILRYPFVIFLKGRFKRNFTNKFRKEPQI